MVSVLFSDYIIDGVDQELTPAQLLGSCMDGYNPTKPTEEYEAVVDESVDRLLRPCITKSDNIESYLRDVTVLKNSHTAAKVIFTDFYTRQRIAVCLLDALWRKGHFKLGNIMLDIDWKWCSDHMGNLADFYNSVAAASDYMDALGIKLKSYTYTDVPGKTMISVKASVMKDGVSDKDSEEFSEGLSSNLSLSTRRARPNHFQNDKSSWIVYVPFDNGKYQLGGSLLAESLGVSGEASPQLLDADYFIDCYEVVREMVEDGIILAGTTVGYGGLMYALQSMTDEGIGADIDLWELMHATGEQDIVRLLFAEVPGAIIQIADLDYDYIDAEFLLQDVAFYPLGHITDSHEGVRVAVSQASPVMNLLESVIRSRSSEGED